MKSEPRRKPVIHAKLLSRRERQAAGTPTHPVNKSDLYERRSSGQHGPPRSRSKSLVDPLFITTLNWQGIGEEDVKEEEDSNSTEI